MIREWLRRSAKRHVMNTAEGRNYAVSCPLKYCSSPETCHSALSQACSAKHAAAGLVRRPMAINAISGPLSNGQDQGTKRKEPDVAEEAPEEAPGYGDGVEYWNKRYRGDPNPFEWLESFAELESLIKEATSGRTDAAVLHVGCGNSLLPEAMYDHGYKDVTNIDIAEVCIQQMAERNRTLRPELKWFEMDATEMGLIESSFDAVIDKSVLDTFACGDNASTVINKYLLEVQRVLRPRGTFLCVSYGVPNTRLDYFKGKGLNFAIKQVPIPVKLPGGSVHYAYLLRKGITARS
ncbi:EEF1AKNMT [Symbiodinium natans]|uniref:EEF1AKNMT protein n=1 Tax=Symbiodinium natans TaxID=878477 RepID=A0A812T161_9DINO|nr:EEF1AKNMT [Symbiodinium natans]